MKKILMSLVVVLAMLPAVCMANENFSKKVTLNLGVSAFTFNKTFVKGDSRYGSVGEKEEKIFSIGDIESYFSIGYSLTRLVELGGQIKLLVHSRGGSRIVIGLAPYLKFNFWVNDKIMFPLTIMGGFESEIVAMATTTLGSIGLKQGMDFVVNDVLTLGPYIMGSFKIGGANTESDGYHNHYDIKQYSIGLGFGLTFWI